MQEEAPQLEVPNRFQGKTFYECLGIERDATAAEIRSAYRKQALRFHPDHNKQEGARADFQFLTLVYQTLSDEKKRTYYDRTGEVLETSQQFDDAYKAWRLVFPEITPADIEKFRDTYLGSAAEEEDVIEAFDLAEGDMDVLMTAVPYADADSAERIVGVVERLLKEGRLESASDPQVKRRFARTRKGLARRLREETPDELAEAEELARELNLPGTRGGGGDEGLHALILSRQRDRQQAGAAFLDQLAAKYSGMEKQQKPKKKDGAQKAANKKEGKKAGGKRKAAEDSEEGDEHKDDHGDGGHGDDARDFDDNQRKQPKKSKGNDGQSKRLKRK